MTKLCCAVEKENCPQSKASRGLSFWELFPVARGHLGNPKAGPQEPTAFASIKMALQSQAMPRRKGAESKATISSSRK